MNEHKPPYLDWKEGLVWGILALYTVAIVAGIVVSILGVAGVL